MGFRGTGRDEDFEGWDGISRDGTGRDGDFEGWDGISRDFEGRDGILREGIPFLSRSCPVPIPIPSRFPSSLIIPSPSRSYHQLEHAADIFNIGTYLLSIVTSCR
jgi:hypothetical protein